MDTTGVLRSYKNDMAHNSDWWGSSKEHLLPGAGDVHGAGKKKRGGND